MLTFCSFKLVNTVKRSDFFPIQFYFLGLMHFMLVPHQNNEKTILGRILRLFSFLMFVVSKFM